MSPCAAAQIAPVWLERTDGARFESIARMLTMGYQAVRTERYKYITYSELRGMDELYDLATDPFEMDNLMGSARGRALVPELQAELSRLQGVSGFKPPASR